MNVIGLGAAVGALLAGVALVAWALRWRRGVLSELRTSRERFMLVAEGAIPGKK